MTDREPEGSLAIGSSPTGKPGNPQERSADNEGISSPQRFVRPAEQARPPAAGDRDPWLRSVLDQYRTAEGLVLRRSLNCDVEILFEPDRLRRDLLNVLDNACQAMTSEEARRPNPADREPLLSVASEVANERVEILISDSGLGIASGEGARFVLWLPLKLSEEQTAA